jgi:hypothetical protein
MLRDDPSIAGDLAKKFKLSFGPNQRARYPFKRMGVGDYFPVPPEVSANALRSAIQSFHRKATHTQQFSVRQAVGEPHKWVCRRIA